MSKQRPITTPVKNRHRTEIAQKIEDAYNQLLRQNSDVEEDEEVLGEKTKNKKTNRELPMLEWQKRKCEIACLFDFTVREMLSFASVSDDDYYRQIKNDPKFEKRIEKARHSLFQVAKVNIALDVIEGSIAMSTWLLEKRQRKEYADRKEVTGLVGTMSISEETELHKVLERELLLATAIEEDLLGDNYKGDSEEE